MATNVNIADNHIVTLLLFPIPLLKIPLYQFQWMVMWNMVTTRNNILAITWNTAQSCHISWMLPCPAICNFIPVYAVRANNNVKAQSIIKIRFIILPFVRLDCIFVLLSPISL